MAGWKRGVKDEDVGGVRRLEPSRLLSRAFPCDLPAKCIKQYQLPRELTRPSLDVVQDPIT